MAISNDLLATGGGGVARRRSRSRASPPPRFFNGLIDRNLYKYEMPISYRAVLGVAGPVASLPSRSPNPRELLLGHGQLGRQRPRRSMAFGMRTTAAFPSNHSADRRSTAATVVWAGSVNKRRTNRGGVLVDRHRILLTPRRPFFFDRRFKRSGRAARRAGFRQRCVRKPG